MTKKRREVEGGAVAWLGDQKAEAVSDRLTLTLDRLFAGPEEGAIRQAQTRLRASLEPVCYFDAVSTPRLGKVYVAVTAQGLAGVEFGISEAAFLASLRRRVTGRIERAAEPTAEARRQIAEYVQGSRTTFDLPIDWTALTDFQRRVLRAALAVRRGQVATYGEIARRIGRPRASRAVGQALGHNPFPLVIPCHRVLGSDGSLRGYGGGGGTKTKAWLLQLEGASF